MKPVFKLDEKTGKRDLFIVPDTDLEERFFLWFGFQFGIFRQRINNRESLRFPGGNDPDQTIENLQQAMKKFCERYRYLEVPNVIGLPLEEAKRRLEESNIQWAVEKEIFSKLQPPGYVVFQNPRPGAASKPNSMVYLDVSKGEG